MKVAFDVVNLDLLHPLALDVERPQMLLETLYYVDAVLAHARDKDDGLKMLKRYDRSTHLAQRVEVVGTTDQRGLRGGERYITGHVAYIIPVSTKWPEPEIA
ncbi:TPA: hypothetical protein ACSJ7Z_002835 [Escherichia coli]|uniref:hypothetical protein n=1 Tax=Escherichia coli TaxID=562 RepID=UPI00156099CA|nr:hypothetical protein [Escherichia coli]EEZ9252209.1 hypothetical protein [Escherichia coli]EFM2186750.1 hypothetical protein [Escherichia coli]EKK4593492.1 hypothetical protein [Escherichia coli]EKY4869978.1 hypothetical protein [Escherichia coli]ELR8650580.1 hypothetical protein [Escherichia coli]